MRPCASSVLSHPADELIWPSWVMVPFSMRIDVVCLSSGALNNLQLVISSFCGILIFPCVTRASSPCQHGQDGRATQIFAKLFS